MIIVQQQWQESGEDQHLKVVEQLASYNWNPNAQIYQFFGFVLPFFVSAPFSILHFEIVLQTPSFHFHPSQQSVSPFLLFSDTRTLLPLPVRKRPVGCRQLGTLCRPEITSTYFNVSVQETFPALNHRFCFSATLGQIGESQKCLQVAYGVIVR
jgi:hypothetical protein